jgi:rhodanese-related sulfurtransferase
VISLTNGGGELFLKQAEHKEFFMTKFKFALASIFAFVLVLGVSACSPGTLEVSDVTAIIDTRAAESFATSHIVGSANVPYEGGGFFVNVSEFGKSGKYYVYGADETEAGKAMGDMLSLGFTNVINLGSFKDAQRVLPLGVTP